MVERKGLQDQMKQAGSAQEKQYFQQLLQSCQSSIDMLMKALQIVELYVRFAARQACFGEWGWLVEL